MIKNLVDKIIRYEGGDMDMEETILFFQELVDTGLAWSLQGSYGRMAHTLIGMGEVVDRGKIDLGPLDCE